MSSIEDYFLIGGFHSAALVGADGENNIILRFKPRPSYGAHLPTLRTTSEGTPCKAGRFDLGEDTVYLHFPDGVEISEDGEEIRFRLEAGQEKTRYSIQSMFGTGG